MMNATTTKAKRMTKAQRAQAEKAAEHRARAANLFRTARYWLNDARRCRLTGNAEGERLSLENARLDRAAAKTWFL